MAILFFKKITCNQGKKKRSCPERTGNYKTWRAILIAAKTDVFLVRKRQHNDSSVERLFSFKFQRSPSWTRWRQTEKKNGNTQSIKLWPTCKLDWLMITCCYFFVLLDELWFLIKDYLLFQGSNDVFWRLAKLCSWLSVSTLAWWGSVNTRKSSCNIMSSR